MIIGLGIGIIAGVLSGIFGIGGGIIIVPLLTLLLGFHQSKSVGTSLASMLLPVGILAVIKYAKNSDVDFKIAAMIAVGIFIMAFVGARISLSIGETWVSRLFGILLILLGARYIFFAK